ncbi:hypothetical protein ACMT4L_09785 [Deinococcus sp. A31D244]|uniref:hypothetical protein n=1 Tax=Deinococcus sp. A31D244 TaxID=3397675 RepID=UPI0039E17ECC
MPAPLVMLQGQQRFTARLGPLRRAAVQLRGPFRGSVQLLAQHVQYGGQRHHAAGRDGRQGQPGVLRGLHPPGGQVQSGVAGMRLAPLLQGGRLRQGRAHLARQAAQQVADQIQRREGPVCVGGQQGQPGRPAAQTARAGRVGLLGAAPLEVRLRLLRAEPQLVAAQQQGVIGHKRGGERQRGSARRGRHDAVTLLKALRELRQPAQRVHVRQVQLVEDQQRVLVQGVQRAGARAGVHEFRRAAGQRRLRVCLLQGAEQPRIEDGRVVIVRRETQPRRPAVPLAGALTEEGGLPEPRGGDQQDQRRLAPLELLEQVGAAQLVTQGTWDQGDTPRTAAEKTEQQRAYGSLIVRLFIRKPSDPSRIRPERSAAGVRPFFSGTPARLSPGFLREVFKLCSLQAQEEHPMRTLITALLALIVTASTAHAETSTDTTSTNTSQGGVVIIIPGSASTANPGTGTTTPQGGVVIIMPAPAPTGG